MAIVLIRTVIVFAVLLGGMRLLGKRQLGELELSELVVSVLIADLASLPLQDIGIPLLNGLVSILTLISLELILSGITLRFGRLRSALFGRPCFLIQKGQIDQREMERNRFTVEELTEQLRCKGVLDPATVEYAVLETDGTLNVILSPDYQPATAGQLGCAKESHGYPRTLVSDGRVLSDNLRQSGHDESWLLAQCRKRGAASPEDVFLLTCDAADNIYFCRKEPRA